MTKTREHRAFELLSESWDGLPRQIIMAFDINAKTPRKLLAHLTLCGEKIPDWLRDEPEMKSLDHVISKGTRVVILMKSVQDAALAFVDKQDADAAQAQKEFQANCQHKWRYTGTDHGGSHKGESSYECTVAGCHARKYEMD